MEESIIYLIIRKYLSGRFSSDAEEKIQKWIIKDKDTEEKEKASLAQWNELKPRAEADTQSALERVNRRIGYSKTRQLSLFRKVARIAAVLVPLCIIAGGYLYYTSATSNLIEITVAYGEKKHIILPDSSEIWLNAGTVFKYPQNFTDNERLVYLDGEAYFSVKRDPAKPFIVKASQMRVKVLGTRFNIKAYPNDERITTTLTSGKVEVNAPSQKPRILKPNEQLTYNRKISHISIAEIPTTDIDGWITGKLIFNNATLTEMQQTLERRYNIVIKNTVTIPETARYTVRFLKNEDIEEVMNVLGEIIGFDHQQTGNTIELISKP